MGAPLLVRAPLVNRLSWCHISRAQPKIGPTAIPALWREQYTFMDNFAPREMGEIMLERVARTAPPSPPAHAQLTRAALCAQPDAPHCDQRIQLSQPGAQGGAAPRPPPPPGALLAPLTLGRQISKYYLPVMLNDASALVADPLDRSSVRQYGRPGIRAQLLDTRTSSLVMDFLVEVRWPDGSPCLLPVLAILTATAAEWARLHTRTQRSVPGLDVRASVCRGARPSLWLSRAPLTFIRVLQHIVSEHVQAQVQK